jgi:galactokinase
MPEWSVGQQALPGEFGRQGELLSASVSAYRSAYGQSPEGVWSAPGRVNLIGEHTDYNEGYVLPLAIDRRTVVAAGRRSDGLVRVGSTRSPDEVVVRLDRISPAAVGGWSAYPFGVIWAMTAGIDVTELTGVDLFVDSRVPVGSGLSSSAALGSAVAVALNDLWDLGHDRLALAHAVRKGENEVVGTPTGIMDQFASMFGQDDAAIFIDCRSEIGRVVPLHLEEAGLALLVMDTREHHQNADGGYAARYAACKRAARQLGVAALRDVGVADLEHVRTLLDEHAFRIVRHIVTEDDRVLQAVAALEAREPSTVGALLNASQVSMRDDFEISTPALDRVVEMALRGGALGARMTGGGFGGSAIALLEQNLVPSLTDAVAEAAVEGGFRKPEVYTVRAGAGASRDA